MRRPRLCFSLPNDGIAAVEYELGGTQFRREVFASVPDDVVVLRFAADTPGAIEVGSHFYRRYDAFGRIDGLDHAIGGAVGARGTSFHGRARVIAKQLNDLADTLCPHGPVALKLSGHSEPRNRLCSRGYEAADRHVVGLR